MYWEWGLPTLTSSLPIGRLNRYQKANHFAGSWCLGRKDLLARHLYNMHRSHGAEFDFHAKSYVLPQATAAQRSSLPVSFSPLRANDAPPDARLTSWNHIGSGPAGPRF